MGTTCVAGTYIKFCFWFTQSPEVCTIHKEDNAIDGREVVFPHPAGWVNKQNLKKKKKILFVNFSSVLTLG